MTREEIELLEADAFNPAYVYLFGVAKCRRIVREMLFPETHSKFLGLNYWLSGDINKVQRI